MTLAYGWPPIGPGSAWSMTVTRLLWWVRQGNRRAAAQRKA